MPVLKTETTSTVNENPSVKIMREFEIEMPITFVNRHLVDSGHDSTPFDQSDFILLPIDGKKVRRVYQIRHDKRDAKYC